MRSVWAAGAAVFVLAMASQAQAAPPPASAFGRVPAVIQASISPDGSRVAVLGGQSDERVLSIATLDRPELPQLRLGDVEAVSLRWAGNDHVLARLAYWEQVTGRVAYRFERTVAVTPEGKAVSRLLDTGANNLLVSQPILGVTTDGGKPRVLMTGLMDSGGPSGNANTRLARKGEESSFVLALWSVDPATGRGAIVEKGNYDTVSWEVDSTGKPRVRLDLDENTHAFSAHGRAQGKASYAEVFRGADFGSRRNYYGFSAPDDAIVLAEGGRLMKKSLADGSVQPFGPETLSTNPSLVWDEDRAEVVGVSTGAEKATVAWTDPQIGAVHATLTRVFKGKQVDLTGWSADRGRVVARVAGPAAPGAWYLFDVARKEVSPLGDEYPELKDAALGQTRWITYKARDGLEIPAYLTLPPAGAATGKPPLIVLPHGGPRARDTYDFDYIAQFLATRGYAVLQPQFRGSWGFGDAFEKAGDGEWGGKMQTDLLDGVAALAAQGEVDAGRACIVGGSFGGYSALAGAALYPGSYRCAASIAGIADLGQLLLEQGRAYGRDSAGLDELRAMVGQAAPQKLAATSPAQHAAAVRSPVLLIHGDKDTVVQLSQSQRMAEALKAAGKPYEFVVLEGENHYLTRSSSRTRALEVLEAFLAKHLPVS